MDLVHPSQIDAVEQAAVEQVMAGDPLDVIARGFGAIDICFGRAVEQLGGFGVGVGTPVDGERPGIAPTIIPIITPPIIISIGCQPNNVLKPKIRFSTIWSIFLFLRTIRRQPNIGNYYLGCSTLEKILYR